MHVAARRRGLPPALVEGLQVLFGAGNGIQATCWLLEACDPVLMRLWMSICGRLHWSPASTTCNLTTIVVSEQL